MGSSDSDSSDEGDAKRQQLLASALQDPLVASALPAGLMSELSSALTSEVSKRTLKVLAAKLPESHPDSVTAQRLKALKKVLKNI